MASLISLVRQITQEPSRTARASGYDLPWTNPLYAIMFAQGKFSRCVGKDGVNIELALVEAPDVMAYLDRWFHLVCGASPMDGISDASNEELVEAIGSAAQGVEDASGYMRLAFAVLDQVAEFKSGVNATDIVISLRGKPNIDDSVYFSMILLELGYRHMTGLGSVPKALQ